MSSFKTFNGYEVEDANARKNVGELSKVTPGIGMVDGTDVTITDSTEGAVIDLEVKGRSTQNGTPTPDSPIEIKSVADSGWFDGELIQGVYAGATGAWGSSNTYVCNKNIIPCKANDKIKLEYEGTTSQLMILFYDKNKNFISYAQSQSSSVLETTAVANACYFNFNVANPNDITPTNAKPISITINDKCALIVDSVGKNNYKIDIVYSSASQNGISLTTDVEKGTATVNGTATADFGNYLSIESSNQIIRKGSYVLSSNVVGSSTTYGLGFGYKSIVGGSTNYKWVYDTEVTVEFTTDVIVFPLIQVKGGVTVNNITFCPMIRPQGTDATFEPYKKSRKYIPISVPLRGIGEITDVASLSECEVTRRFTEVVFDGSDDDWKTNSDVSVFYIIIDNIKKLQSCLCDHYSNVYTNSFGYLCINTSDTSCTTLAEFKAWLQANPITVIYELAEPTNESIGSTEIVTYDNVTQISVSDNAGCKVSYYRDNEDGKKIQELDNRMMIAEDTINNLESNAVDVADDIEDIKSSMLNPNLKALTPSDEPYTIASGTAGNVISFKDTWLNRPLNDCEYLLIVITHRNKTKQIVTIPSIMLSEGATYSFPFNDVQNTIYGAYIKIDTFTRYSIGLYGTAPSDITFMLYNYGHPISVG